MRDEPIDPAFCFTGSAESIATKQALVSQFRKQNGMNPDPFGAITGSPQEVEQKLALLRDFKNRL